MSEWLPMLFFLSALFVSTLMVLVCGFVSIRAERARASAGDESGDQSVPHDTPFFADLGASVPARSMEPSGNGLEGALRSYLEREERVVAGFVAHPSVDSLYSGAARPVAAKNLKRYLERELQYASGFVADPSVESLYRRSERPAWIN